jgi:hypothetical protein
MTLTLSNVPGFADQSDSILQHDKPALGMALARISENAAFGMVRTEVFSGTYINGDTVPTPTSAVDGYRYQRNELFYVWAPQNTGNPKNNWASSGPPWTLWYVAFTRWTRPPARSRAPPAIAGTMTTKIGSPTLPMELFKFGPLRSANARRSREWIDHVHGPRGCGLCDG